MTTRSNVKDLGSIVGKQKLDRIDAFLDKRKTKRTSNISEIRSSKMSIEPTSIDPLVGMDERSFLQNVMQVSVPASAQMTMGAPRRTYRRRYGGGKELAKLRKYKSRMQARLKAQKAQITSELGPDQIRLRFGESFKLADEAQKRARVAHNFYGKGDYKTWLAHISRGVGSLAGGAMGYMGGGLTGLAEGAQSGYSRGGQFSKFMGWGDYGTIGNQIMGGSNKGQMSVNETDSSGDVYITQTEFVQNVSCTNTGSGASAFQITKFQINPGLSVTFPFLSQIAQNYTLYEFEGLIFKFNPTSGENNATSNSLGKVILATQYDPDAPQFINSVQMENYDYANAAKPSMTIFHGVETDNNQQAINMQYVRTGVTAKDLIFTDIGTFYVATEGVPFAAAGTQILGELWVTYRIKLSRANLYGSLLGQNISQDILTGSSSATALVTGTVSAKDTNQIGCTIVNVDAATMRIKFPVNISLGTYQVMLVLAFGSTPFDTQTIDSVGFPINCQFSIPGTVLPGTGNYLVSAPGGSVAGTSSNNVICSTTWVTVSAPGNTQASFVFTVDAAMTATTTWTVYITQYNQVATLS